VPADWESLSDEALAMLCERAAIQPPRPRADAEVGRSGQSREEPLHPKLQQVQRRLDQTLDEVCDAPPAEKLDTGELIRVEESLALAAEAAKEAVSLRRRMRVDRDRSDEGRGDENPPAGDKARNGF
jgi:hypothetical protein